MDRHCENAMKVAEFLESHPSISVVNYPGLESFPQHKLAKKQMSQFGGTMSFEVKGGVEAGIKLLNSLEICTLAVSLGDTTTLIEHPASMTHACVPKAKREQGGLTDGLVRISVGLENIEDLVAAMEQALAKV